MKIADLYSIIENDVINLQNKLVTIMAIVFIMSFSLTVSSLTFLDLTVMKNEDDPKRMSWVKSATIGLIIGLVGSSAMYFFGSNVLPQKMKNIPEMILKSDFFENIIEAIPSKIGENEFSKKLLAKLQNTLLNNLDLSGLIKTIKSVLIKSASSIKMEKTNFIADYMTVAAMFLSAGAVSFVNSKKDSIKDKACAIFRAVLFGAATVILPIIVFEFFGNAAGHLAIKKCEEKIANKVKEFFVPLAEKSLTRVGSMFSNKVQVFHR